MLIQTPKLKLNIRGSVNSAVSVNTKPHSLHNASIIVRHNLTSRRKALMRILTARGIPANIKPLLETIRDDGCRKWEVWLPILNVTTCLQPIVLMFVLFAYFSGLFTRLARAPPRPPPREAEFRPSCTSGSRNTFITKRIFQSHPTERV